MTMTHADRDFLFAIDDLPNAPACTVDFPDLPDVITSGETLPWAFADACEALDLHPESLQKPGLPSPRPTRRFFVETVRRAAT